jgi:hypothetical protein
LPEARKSTDPQVADPNQVGYSLANVGEMLTACLDAVGARSVLEIGAYRGELTALLLEWAAGSGASIAAVDPLPPIELRGLAAEHPDLDLIEETSLDMLGRIDLPDALILDGDHNYFTLSAELRLIAERSEGRLPLLMFHDVGWPHARRDSYYAPERIPDDARQPLAENAGLVPGNAETVADGLPLAHAARREGGERNGVLTAIEDFMEVEDGLRLVRVPAFFGFGVLWREDAAYAEELAAFLEPFDGNTVMARLEANRVAHLVKVFALGARLARQEREMRLMLGSKAFTLAEAFSRLRRRPDGPAFSRRRVHQALGDIEPD